MTEDAGEQARRETAAFAAQILGLDGVSDGPAPEGSVVWRLAELEREFAAEGRSSEEYFEAAQIILMSQPVPPGEPDER